MNFLELYVSKDFLFILKSPGLVTKGVFYSNYIKKNAFYIWANSKNFNKFRWGLFESFCLNLALYSVNIKNKHCTHLDVVLYYFYRDTRDFESLGSSQLINRGKPYTKCRLVLNTKNIDMNKVQNFIEGQAFIIRQVDSRKYPEGKIIVRIYRREVPSIKV